MEWIFILLATITILLILINEKLRTIIVNLNDLLSKGNKSRELELEKGEEGEDS